MNMLNFERANKVRQLTKEIKELEELINTDNISLSYEEFADRLEKLIKDLEGLIAS